MVKYLNYWMDWNGFFFYAYVHAVHLMTLVSRWVTCFVLLFGFLFNGLPFTLALTFMLPAGWSVITFVDPLTFLWAPSKGQIFNKPRLLLFNVRVAHQNWLCSPILLNTKENEEFILYMNGDEWVKESHSDRKEDVLESLCVCLWLTA